MLPSLMLTWAIVFTFLALCILSLLFHFLILSTKAQGKLLCKSKTEHKLHNHPCARAPLSLLPLTPPTPERTPKLKRPAAITDLNSDVLRVIMLLLANSSDGPINLARMMLVCKFFKACAEEEEVLKSVQFEKHSFFSWRASCCNLNGLLDKCAHAGNAAALDMIKVHLKVEKDTLRETLYSYDQAIKRYSLLAIITSFRGSPTGLEKAQKIRNVVEEYQRSMEKAQKEYKEVLDRCNTLNL